MEDDENLMDEIYDLCDRNRRLRDEMKTKQKMEENEENMERQKLKNQRGSKITKADVNAWNEQMKVIIHKKSQKNKKMDKEREKEKENNILLNMRKLSPNASVKTIDQNIKPHGKRRKSTNDNEELKELRESKRTDDDIEDDSNMDEAQEQKQDHKKEEKSTTDTLLNEETELEINTSSSSAFNYDLNFFLMLNFLTLEQPKITPSLMDCFLGQDLLCALLINLIVLLKSSSENHVDNLFALIQGPVSRKEILSENYVQRFGNRETKKNYCLLMEKNAYVNEKATEVPSDLLYSYRTVTFLTTDDRIEKENVRTFLSERSELVITCLLCIFQPNSGGILYHGCYILDYLLRLFPDEFYFCIMKFFPVSVENMLDNLDVSCVRDLVLSMISKPIMDSRADEYAVPSSNNKKEFFDKLVECRLMNRIIDNMMIHEGANAESEIKGEINYMSPAVAIDFYCELIERLIADNSPTHCPIDILGIQEQKVVERLFHCLLDDQVRTHDANRSDESTSRAELLHKILRNCNSENVRIPSSKPYTFFHAICSENIPNKLFPYKTGIFTQAESCFPLLKSFLIEGYPLVTSDGETKWKSIIKRFIFEEDSASTSMEGSMTSLCSTKYNMYSVCPPFTELRLSLVNILVLLVFYNPELLSRFGKTLWRQLSFWFFRYPHNNLYHYSYCQLFYAAIRLNNEDVYIDLLEKTDLVTLFIQFYNNPQHKASNKGYILQCCNVLRLQAQLFKPKSFLRNHLAKHTLWKNFTNILRETTILHQQKGFGLEVPKPPLFNGVSPYENYNQENQMKVDELESGIDHGSHFAQSLGFINEKVFSSSEEDNGNITNDN